MKPRKDNKTRLSSKFTVDPVTGCHNFTGNLNNAGYGLFRYHVNEVLSKMISVSRASYLMYVGPLEPGQMVIHTCNNKKCINPEHLLAGTRTEMIKHKLENIGKVFGKEKGYKMRLTECEHCHQTVAVNTYGRYHGNKCKHYTEA
jgi:hypothetical protein